MKGSEGRRRASPTGAFPQAFEVIRALAARGADHDAMRTAIERAVADPDSLRNDAELGGLATVLTLYPRFSSAAPGAGARRLGRGAGSGSVKQMANAAELPVAVRGALMPDAHRGYGLPIGGVLATENAVIPYAVGVDIACRMKLSVLDIAGRRCSNGSRDQLERALRSARRGSASAASCQRARAARRAGRGLDASRQSPRGCKDKAPGAARHERQRQPLRRVRLARRSTAPDLGLAAGQVRRPALSHSGSRGIGRAGGGALHRAGRASCTRSCRRSSQHLAWLDLDTEAGQEYWAAMNLMGDYAAANHALIHSTSPSALGATSSPASRTITTSPGRKCTTAGS